MAIISYDEKPGIQAIERPPPTCRPSPACMRPSHVSMNINVTARSACWPASTSSPARSMRWSRIAIAAANSSNSSSFRRRLSGPHSDQVDPRQSFRAHLQRDQSLARRSTRAPLSNSPSLPSTAPGSTSSRASSLNLPAPSSATSASRPNRNSRIGSWLPWTISIRSPSFTPGPISSTRRPDMIRTSKTLV